MARRTAHKVPSKAQLATDERRWRAEGMVKDAFMQSPFGKQQVKVALREITRAEKAIKAKMKAAK